MPEIKPKVVIILGAGASQDAGAPLMNNFLDVAEHLLWSGKLQPEDQKPFETVFKGLASLQGIYAKSYLELDNIETVFAAFEMAELLKIQIDLETDISLTQAIRKLIVVTLEKSIEFPLSDTFVSPTSSYATFAEAMSQTTREANTDITIITFNYDIALDFALFYHRVAYDYCLSPKPQSNGIRLLKLHGSLNWVHCPHCDNVMDWSFGEIASAMPMRVLASRAHAFKSATQAMPVTSWLQNEFKHSCGQPLKPLVSPQPLIVPPTWSKGEHHRQIAQVWQRAAKDLQDASVIVVSGYSLPETDHFFRYLFALGTMGQTRLKRFFVLDPKMEDVSPRYKNLLGPLAKQRFQSNPCTFQTFASNLEKFIRFP